MAAPIQDLRALQILDSRGTPTLEVEIRLADGTVATAQVPSGASTGIHEASELRDGEGGAYAGRSVTNAVANVTTTIADALRGHPADQAQVDRLLVDLDGTPDKSRLGANAILGVSCAAARAIAASESLPLWRSLAGDRQAKIPLPMVNILSGGLHARGRIEFQDFLAVPHGCSSFAEALAAAAAVHRTMRSMLAEDRRAPDGVADEGGWGPRLDSNEQALEYMVRAIERAGFDPGSQIAIAIDAAASHFHSDGAYRLASEGRVLDAEGMLAMYERWIDAFPIVSIEDPFAEDDWAGWQRALARCGSRCALIGDDLLVTNPERLERAISTRAANSVLVKMNQIGTLTETLQVVDRAEEAGFAAVVSARSGETEDSFLADLATATGAGHIKVGSVTRSERLAKYNRLLRIEAGWDGIAPQGLAPTRPLVHDGNRGGVRVSNA